jgi:hypothetical protein
MGAQYTECAVKRRVWRAQCASVGRKNCALPVTHRGINLQVKYSFSSFEFFLWQVGLGQFWYLQDKLIKNKCYLSSNRVEFDTDPQYGL